MQGEENLNVYFTARLRKKKQAITSKNRTGYIIYIYIYFLREIKRMKPNETPNKQVEDIVEEIFPEI